MRSFFGKEFRAVVLTVVFSMTLFAPAAEAAPVQPGRLPDWRDAIARIVRVIQGRFGGTTSNADSLAIPRP